MFIFPHFIVGKLDFNQIMLKLLAGNPTNKAFKDQVIHRTIMIIAMASGLPLKEVIHLEWKDIVTTDSRGQISITKEFNGIQDLTISIKLSKQLLDNYKSLNQPKLESKIINGLSKHKEIDELLLPLNIAIGIHKTKGIDKEAYISFKNKYLTQILFGRRVFEVFGYTNETCQYLKKHLKIRTHQKLFDFLGYKSKEDIEYHLSDISMIEGTKDRFIHGDPPCFLEDDKHFSIPKEDSADEYYPFQHFQVFYDFLNNIRQKEYSILTQAIVSVLTLSLTNGIRLSTLLNLKWSDLFIKGTNLYHPYLIIKKKVTLGRFQLHIDMGTAEKILLYYQGILYYKGIEAFNIKDKLTFHGELPDLDDHCFVNNQQNPITSHNIKRYLDTALKELNFEHAKKFTLKSTLIMYGRRIVELKGNHKPTIQLLKEHFKYRRAYDLFKFLYISEQKGNKGEIIEINSVFDHILYDI